MGTEFGIPFKSEPCDLTTTDHVFAMDTHAIYSDSDGTIVAQLSGDDFDSSWEVAAGDYLLGHWRHVTKAGTTATGLKGVRGHIS